MHVPALAYRRWFPLLLLEQRERPFGLCSVHNHSPYSFTTVLCDREDDTTALRNFHVPAFRGRKVFRWGCK